MPKYACPIHGHLCETKLKNVIVMCGHPHPEKFGRQCRRRAKVYTGRWKSLAA